ncbi:hypothetical protein FBU31_006522, partial [Coemansia sp. 'formosensis']
AGGCCVLRCLFGAAYADDRLYVWICVYCVRILPCVAVCCGVGRPVCLGLAPVGGTACCLRPGAVIGERREAGGRI